jgi:hypothetical protein
MLIAKKLARRMTESEFEENLVDMFNSLRKVLVDMSSDEFEEFVLGLLKGWFIGVSMIVIRLEGNKGFVFIKSPEEFYKFLIKRYGGSKKLREEFNI